MPRRRRKQRPPRPFWMLLGALVALWLLFVLIQSVASTLGALGIPLVIGAVAIVIYGWVRVRKRRRLRIKAFNELLALTPTQFEMAIADLLRDMGYRSVQRTGRSGDLAADITCRDRKGRSVVVQCKRHAPGIRVGSRDMQAFIGMVKVHHRADNGVFVTTSEFTAPARELARQHEVTLIDGPRLSQLIEIDRRGRPEPLETPAAAENVAAPPDMSR